MKKVQKEIQIGDTVKYKIWTTGVIVTAKVYDINPYGVAGIIYNHPAYGGTKIGAEVSQLKLIKKAKA